MPRTRPLAALPIAAVALAVTAAVLPGTAQAADTAPPVERSLILNAFGDAAAS
jgi:hypothetical protein